MFCVGCLPRTREITVPTISSQRAGHRVLEDSDQEAAQRLLGGQHPQKRKKETPKAKLLFRDPTAWIKVLHLFNRIEIESTVASHTRSKI